MENEVFLIILINGKRFRLENKFSSKFNQINPPNTMLLFSKNWPQLKIVTPNQSKASLLCGNLNLDVPSCREQ